MNGNDLLDKMELIDPEYIEAAEKSLRHRSSVIIKYAAAAACLCILCIGTYFGMQQKAAPKELPSAAGQSPAAAAAVTEDLDPAISLKETELEQKESLNSASAASEDKEPKTQNSAVFSPDITEAAKAAPRTSRPYMISDFQTDVVDLQTIPGNGRVNLSAALTEALKQYGDDPKYRVVIEMYKDGVLVDGGSAEIAAETKRLSDEGYITAYESFCDGENTTYTLTIHASKDQLESFPPAGDFGYILKLYGEVFDGGIQQPEVFSGTDIIKTLPLANDTELSFDDAKKDPDYGKYLPSFVPKGFKEESFRKYSDGAGSFLSACWTKGYDEISWHICMFEPAHEALITEASEKEKYDLSLYPIPRAESVPDELREIVDNPIFRWEDLTYDEVMARAYKIYDAGDSSGYRINFGVKYGSYLVWVRTKGAAPEWLFEQLKNLI